MMFFSGRNSFLDAFYEATGVEPEWVTGDEWHGPCPNCGGEDRCFIRTDKIGKDGSVGWSHCRGCKDARGTESWFRWRFLGEKPERKERVERVEGVERGERSERWASYDMPDKEWSSRVLDQIKLMDSAFYRFWSEWLDGRGISWDSGVYAPVELVEDSDGNLCMSWPAENPVAVKKRTRHGQYLCEQGSYQGPWVFGCSVVDGSKIDDREASGDKQRLDYSKLKEGALGRVYVAESELDAIALWGAAVSRGGFVLVISTGGCCKMPDAELAGALADYEILMVHDNDKAGLKMLEAWQAMFPGQVVAKPVPYGKDVGEFVQMGGDLQSWLMLT